MTNNPLSFLGIMIRITKRAKYASARLNFLLPPRRRQFLRAGVFAWTTRSLEIHNRLDCAQQLQSFLRHEDKNVLSGTKLNSTMLIDLEKSLNFFKQNSRERKKLPFASSWKTNFKRARFTFFIISNKSS